MMKKRTTTRGFSLSEVLIASAVMLVGTSLLVSMTANVAHFEVEEQMQNRIELETALLLDYLERDVKASTGLISDYAGAGAYLEDNLTLKIPEFDENGIMDPINSDYAVYTYNWTTKTVTRTLYDDEAAAEEKNRIEIPVGDCYFMPYVDGDPAWVSDGGPAQTVQIYAYRWDDIRGKYYSREFTVASTFRNAAEAE